MSVWKLETNVNCVNEPWLSALLGLLAKCMAHTAWLVDRGFAHPDQNRLYDAQVSHYVVNS